MIEGKVFDLYGDHQVKILLIIKQILPVSTLGKSLEISMENMHTDVMM